MNEPLTHIQPPPLRMDPRNLEDDAPTLDERARRARVRQQIEDLMIERRQKRADSIV